MSHNIPDGLQVASDLSGSTIESKLRIVGVGRAGVSTLDQLVLHGHESYDSLAIDCDQQAIDGSVVPHKMLIANDLLRGLGTRGDAELATQALVHSLGDFDQALNGTLMLVLVTGLGGGIGNALALHLAKEARKRSIPTVGFVALPFACEGRARKQRAEETLIALRQSTDALMIFSHDRLTTLPAVKSNARNAFYSLSRAMAHAVEAFAQCALQSGMMEFNFNHWCASFAPARNPLSLECCWTAFGEIESHENHGTLLQRLFESPLLYDGYALDQANRVMISITSGSELGLQAIEHLTVEIGKRLPEKLEMSVAANHDMNARGSLRVTMFLARVQTVETTVNLGIATPELRASMTELAAITKSQPEVESIQLKAEGALTNGSKQQMHIPLAISSPLQKDLAYISKVEKEEQEKLTNEQFLERETARACVEASAQALSEALDSLSQGNPAPLINADRKTLHRSRASSKQSKAAMPYISLKALKTSKHEKKEALQESGSPENALSTIRHDSSTPSEVSGSGSLIEPKVARANGSKTTLTQQELSQHAAPAEKTTHKGRQPKFQAPEIPDEQLMPYVENEDQNGAAASAGNENSDLQKVMKEIPSDSTGGDCAPGEGGLSRNQLARQDEAVFFRFENVGPTVHQGQDLDQPAFRRRRRAIRI